VSDISACKACGRQILWAVTVKKKRIPLEYDRRHIPDDMPPNIAYTRPSHGAATCRVLKAGERKEPEETVTVSHFAICPKAREFRRRP
jgi:hypothetical protein